LDYCCKEKKRNEIKMNKYEKLHDKYENYAR
jgi:hypothetical protein